ncbi:MAG: hypothetical protein QGG36_13270 [Pirellulaceae bacterium]|jgi:hypothetical protein|nr:hypothetical protein [Pirellulaceae bacterium]MDP7016766.1 hypothetical protein [Pirellulaceae bacterium]
MIDVDFLPARYAQQRRAQRMRLWQFSLFAAFGAIVVAAAVFQASLNGHVAAELARLKPMHTAAQAKKQAHAQLAKRLAVEHQIAHLYAFAGVTRPVTQVLGPLVDNAPDSLVFREIRLLHRRIELDGGPTIGEEEEETSPAERETKRLEEERAGRRQILVIQGRALNASSLQDFAQQLRQNGVYQSVELESLTSVAANDTTRLTEFSLKLVIKPPGARSRLNGRAARESETRR